MSDQNVIEGHENKEVAAKQDCGLLKIFGKKSEKHHEEDATMADNEQISGLQQPHEKKDEAKHALDEVLHRSFSSSSDEEGDGESKRRKKKGIKEKTAGRHGEDCPVEQKEAMHAEAAAGTPEEKKGIIEKIKQKISGKKKNGKSHITPAATPPDPCGPGFDGNTSMDGEPRKGILEKIKDKVPGHHKNGEETKKED